MMIGAIGSGASGTSAPAVSTIGRTGRDGGGGATATGLCDEHPTSRPANVTTSSRGDRFIVLGPRAPVARRASHRPHGNIDSRRGQSVSACVCCTSGGMFHAETEMSYRIELPARPARLHKNPAGLAKIAGRGGDDRPLADENLPARLQRFLHVILADERRHGLRF